MDESRGPGVRDEDHWVNPAKWRVLVVRHSVHSLYKPLLQDFTYQ